MNRRQFLGVGSTLAASASLASTRALAVADDVPGESAALAPKTSRLAPVQRAFEYLDFAMDAYQQGATPRLIQTYADQADLGSTAYVADSAIAVTAYLLRGRRSDLDRARLLGDSLLYAQAHDPVYSDGRLRDAYWVGPFDIPGAHTDSYFVRDDGFVNLVGPPFSFLATATVGVAWAGVALTRLYKRTRDRRYLDGAIRLGDWIVENAHDDVGPGGFSFGVDNDNQRITNIKSGEHNALACALFANLAAITGESGWAAEADHARAFLEYLWNPDGGFFYVGSDGAGDRNTTTVATNVETLSYLVLRTAPYGAGLDWAKTNLATTDTPQAPHSNLSGTFRVSGVSFTSGSRHPVQPASDPQPDPDAVWFEGNSQLAAALRVRQRGPDGDLPGFYGDVATAAALLEQVALIQSAAARSHFALAQTVNGAAGPDGAGVLSASSTLDTSFGGRMLQVLHTSATAWYLIAVLDPNPFRF